MIRDIFMHSEIPRKKYLKVTRNARARAQINIL